MNRKKIYKSLSMLCICLAMVFLVGCGNNGATKNGTNGGTNNGGTGTQDDAGGDTGSDTQDDVASGSETGTGNGANTDAGTNGNGDDASGTNTDANNGGTGTTGTPQASEANPINDDIEGFYSETVAYPLLESEIIDELDYENLDMTKTRYYYNYVDLNDDGTDEIIVQLNGDRNTTKDGDTVLIVEQNRAVTGDDDGFDVEAQFTAFANPIIVSDHKTNGYRDLIFQNPDGTYSKVEFGDDEYKDITDAVEIDTLDGITGVALLCNDVASDTKNDTGLFFS